jgi:hypothetical protein
MFSYLLVSMTLAAGQVEPAPTSTSPAPPSATVAPAPARLGAPVSQGVVRAAPDLPPSPYLPRPGDHGQWKANGPDLGEPAKKDNGAKQEDTQPHEEGGLFCRRFIRAYVNEFKKKDDRWEKDDDQAEETPEYRRAMPSPWSSPPFPGSEYQGYPLIGVPETSTVWPFMTAVYGGPWGEQIKESKIKFAGWVTAAGTWSTANNTNVPASYWIVPNRYELDQLVFRLERYPDTVQIDHMDWGFRFIGLYGMDYRYTTAGGWGSDQLLKHNNLYGWDPTEVYANVYIPGFLGGTDIRIGRWIACPDIETQYSVDNYLGSHSILFTYDTYTQTGIMLTQNLNEQWAVQGVLHAGTDMAPWYRGALATGAFGVRWVAKDNNDGIYAWLNAINSAEFRHFQQYGQELGHDNFNYFVATWEHRFSKEIHTKTEAYYMWQRNAELGGTPSAGPLEPYGGGGGNGMLLPGLSQAYGVLNYTMFGISKQDYITVRNEWWKDDRGMRSGFAGNYTSHTIGLSHNINSVLQIRPEIGYYRNWNQPAFDAGTARGLWLYGFDVTLRF